MVVVGVGVGWREAWVRGVCRLKEEKRRERRVDEADLPSCRPAGFESMQWAKDGAGAV
jgi:hypothetical protein